MPDQPTIPISPAILSLPTSISPHTSSLPRGRLTVTESVYCQIPGMVTTRVGKPFYRWLKSIQQVYSRVMAVGEEWVQLDLGWLTSAGQLLVENEAETFNRVPTKEQREAADAKVLIIGAKIAANEFLPLFLVPPGESSRPGIPVDMGALWVRCNKGSTLVTLTIVPE